MPTYTYTFTTNSFETVDFAELEITDDLNTVSASISDVDRTEESICANFNPQIVEEGVSDQVAYVGFSYYL